MNNAYPPMYVHPPNSTPAYLQGNYDDQGKGFEL